MKKMKINLKKLRLKRLLRNRNIDFSRLISGNIGGGYTIVLFFVGGV